MKWVKMKDQAPEENQLCWIYCEYIGIDIMVYHDLEGTKDEIMGKHCFVGFGFLTDDVTHWMPYVIKSKIPEKPKEL